MMIFRLEEFETLQTVFKFNMIQHQLVSIVVASKALKDAEDAIDAAKSVWEGKMYDARVYMRKWVQGQLGK